MISTGAPTLVGAAAVFDCRLIEAKPVATHTVLIGEVVGLQGRRAGSGAFVSGPGLQIDLALGQSPINAGAMMPVHQPAARLDR
jgi:hypothetical protein